MDCYRAHKAGKQAEIAMDDDARLAQVTDTHQTCRGCGIDLYRVVGGRGAAMQPAVVLRSGVLRGLAVQDVLKILGLFLPHIWRDSIYVA